MQYIQIEKLKIENFYNNYSENTWNKNVKYVTFTIDILIYIYI